MGAGILSLPPADAPGQQTAETGRDLRGNILFWYKFHTSSSILARTIHSREDVHPTLQHGGGAIGSMSAARGVMQFHAPPCSVARGHKRHGIHDYLAHQRGQSG